MSPVDFSDRALLLELLAAIQKVESGLTALQGEIRQMRSPSALRPAEIAAIDALGLVFGAGAVSTREIRAAAAEPFGDRPALRKALEAIAPGLRAQTLGIALGSIADRGGAGRHWRLQKTVAERGSRLWTVEGLRGT